MKKKIETKIQNFISTEIEWKPLNDVGVSQNKEDKTIEFLEALENIDERIENARQSAQGIMERIGQIKNGQEKIALQMKILVDSGSDFKDLLKPASEDAFLTLTIELSKVSLEKEEQLIQSMRQLQKILFSTRNKRIEEAIKYFELAIYKDGNFAPAYANLGILYDLSLIHI